MRGVLLVCGGRHYGRWERLCTILDLMHRRMVIECVRHGKATGADELAERWAKLREIPVDPMPADWSTHGRRAGPIRNGEMLAKDPRPIACVAFPGGNGTRDMTDKAERSGIYVWKVDQP